MPITLPRLRVGIFVIGNHSREAARRRARSGSGRAKTCGSCVWPDRMPDRKRQSAPGGGARGARVRQHTWRGGRAHPVRTSPPAARGRVNRVKSARAYSSDESARPPGVARHHGFSRPQQNAEMASHSESRRTAVVDFISRGWDGATGTRPTERARTPTSPAQSPHSI